MSSTRKFEIMMDDSARFVLTDSDRMDKTPYNIKADYHETEHSFRERLDSLIPAEMSERISQVLEKRFRKKMNNDQAVNE